MKNWFNVRLIVLALIIAGSTTLGYSQENEAKTPKEPGKKVSGGFGYFSPGYNLEDHSGLNSYLGNTATKFDDNGITLGGGGVLMIKNFMLGGEGESFLKQTGTRNTQDILLESGSGKFTLGYVLYGKKGILLYPKIGIGGYNYNLTIKETSASTSADSVFAGGFAGTSLSKRGTFMSFGAGFDWMPGFDETAGSGLIFGLEAGYNMSIKENNWESYGTSLSGGPTMIPDGVFIKLHIGFAGWNRQ